MAQMPLPFSSGDDAYLTVAEAAADLAEWMDALPADSRFLFVRSDGELWQKTDWTTGASATSTP
jgi:hypothetical protein